MPRRGLGCGRLLPRRSKVSWLPVQRRNAQRAAAGAARTARTARWNSAAAARGPYLRLTRRGGTSTADDDEDDDAEDEGKDLEENPRAAARPAPPRGVSARAREGRWRGVCPRRVLQAGAGISACSGAMLVIENRFPTAVPFLCKKCTHLSVARSALLFVALFIYPSPPVPTAAARSYTLGLALRCAQCVFANGL